MVAYYHLYAISEYIKLEYFYIYITVISDCLYVTPATNGLPTVKV